MNADLKSVFFNVVGGIIVAGLTAIGISLLDRFRARQLSRLIGFRFGRDAEIRIVYSQFLLPPAGSLHPYVKPPRPSGVPSITANCSIQHPVSESEVRASTYLVSLFGQRHAPRSMFVSDIECDDLLDANFVCLGGPGSNYKTMDVLGSTGNIFMSPSGWALLSGQPLPYPSSSGVDHGFILRVTSPDFPNRSWIVCAGLGEWGTSGAAWYLANRWKSLAKSIHPIAYYSRITEIADFLAIIRVVPGQDQSAHLKALYRNASGRVKKVK